MKEFENDLVLFELSENSRYCWRTVKLINGETLTGSFGTDFDDGDYFLRKEDTLFIPKENVLYYKCSKDTTNKNFIKRWNLL